MQRKYIVCVDVGFMLKDLIREATADPAFVLITSMWYTRRQQPTVIGLWYSANGIGIAIGGILGYGIGNVCDLRKRAKESAHRF